MNKQKMLKFCSIFMSLVCVLSLVAGFKGILNVNDVKNAGLEEKAATLKQLDTLQAGVKKLESNRADYEAGKKKVAAGDIAYAEGVAKLEAGQKEYDAGIATLAKSQKDYDAGMVKYKAGKAQYDAGIKVLNSKTAAYNAGKAQLAAGKAAYDAGKATYTAGKAQYDAGMAQLSTQTDAYNAGKIALAAGKAQYDAAKPTYDALLAKKNNSTASPEELATLNAMAPTILAYEAGMAQVKEYEVSKAMLDAAAKELAAGKAQIDAYEAGMAQVKEYETGKATLDAAAKELAAAKAQLDSGATQLKAGKVELEEAAAQLVAGKAELDVAAIQLKDGKAQIAEFEAGEAQIQAGYDTIAKNPDVKVKIDNGMTPLAAARAVVDEETVTTTKSLTSRLFVNIAIILVAIIGGIAAVISTGVVKAPNQKNVKLSTILGIAALAIAVLANIYGAMNGYTAFRFQMISVIAEAIAALLFVVAIFGYKDTARA